MTTHAKPEATDARKHLCAMIDADEHLYQRIRATPTFSEHFDAIVKLAESVAPTWLTTQNPAALGGCNCYDKAPTIPTFRGRNTHLDDCPAKDSGVPVGVFVVGSDGDEDPHWSGLERALTAEHTARLAAEQRVRELVGGKTENDRKQEPGLPPTGSVAP